jgi:MFS family permease
MSDTKTKFSPSFQKLWSSSAASNVSDGLLKTAVPLLATTLTTDPFWISTIAAIVMLPWLLFAIPVGGLVDRINRRQMLALANTVRLSAALLLALAVGFEFISLPLLLLTTFMFGIGEVIYDTTMQSMIPQVLEKDQLEQGNARLQVTSVTLGEFVGAPLSGLLYAISITLPFLFGAIGVVVAVLLVLTIPLQYSNNLQDHKVVEKKNFWADVRFGIRYLYEHKTLLKLVLLTSSIGFFFSASSSTMVLFLTQTLNVPVALFGVLLAMPAVGALSNFEALGSHNRHGLVNGPLVATGYPARFFAKLHRPRDFGHRRNGNHHDVECATDGDLPPNHSNRVVWSYPWN